MRKRVLHTIFAVLIFLSGVFTCCMPEACARMMAPVAQPEQPMSCHTTEAEATPTESDQCQCVHGIETTLIKKHDIAIADSPVAILALNRFDPIVISFEVYPTTEPIAHFADGPPIYLKNQVFRL